MLCFVLINNLISFWLIMFVVPVSVRLSLILMVLNSRTAHLSVVPDVCLPTRLCVSVAVSRSVSLPRFGRPFYGVQFH